MNHNPSQPTLSRGGFLRTLALGAPLISVAALQAQTGSGTPQLVAKPDLGNLRAFVALARSDLRTEKALIFAENIDFTGDEALEFWPLHREYDLAQNKLFDRRLGLITRYAQQYQAMSDKDATQLANDVFDLEAKRTSLKRKYFKKFSKVISPLKAARFFQIENQINLAIDLQIAAELPLIK